MWATLGKVFTVINLIYTRIRRAIFRGKIEEATKKIETSKGEEDDYSALKEAEDAVYDRKPSDLPPPSDE